MDQRIKTMIAEAAKALKHAYAPYSNYRVAACIEDEEGRFYSGVNIENASYGLTVCAESSAICQMINLNGPQKIKNLIVLNHLDTLCSPCGACRQRIAEFSSSDTIVHLCNSHQLIKSLSIDELLPFAFRFKP